MSFKSHVATLAIGLVFIAPVAAHAEPVCDAVPEVIMLVDRSGSMGETIGGKTKAQIAQTAIEQLLASFTGQLRFGLSMFPKWPHAGECVNATINVAPGDGTAATIKQKLSKATSEGGTPITASLEAVGAHFEGKPGRPRYVVLITDGQETCAAPPKPQTQPGSCAWNNGTNHRRCGGCGWQFCLPNGQWSMACEAYDEYGCAFGQTCEADGRCSGPSGGAMSPSAAATALKQDGVKTFVIGFGSKVDAGALGALAVAGGTSDYFQAGDLTGLEAALTQVASEISCCGNATLDGGEVCDTGITGGQAGACPSACDDGDPCTTDTKVGQGCQQRCEHTPADGCAACGNGQLDAGEACDVGIADGMPGACPISCVDDDPCTSDEASGSGCGARCAFDMLPADPSTPDGCCPKGNTEAEDADCLPPCGPDRTTDCVDLCDGIECEPGSMCVLGACLSVDPLAGAQQVGGGCDCRTGGAGALQAWPLLLPLAALACLLRARRRRRG